MIKSLGIALAAGLVSALLFAVVGTGSPFGMLLSYLAPLPIFIATLGWPHRTGLFAALIGMAAVMVAMRPSAGLVYGIGLGLPAWWIGYLAMLGRPVGEGRSEWYPTGRLLYWIVTVAALITVLGALSLGWSYSEYAETMRSTLARAFRLEAGGAAPSGAPAPIDGMSSSDLLNWIIVVAPFVTAAFFVPVQTFNLWLAAKTVAVSGRLARPWPAIADTMMPRSALLVFGIAIIVAWLPAGYLTFAARALCGALGAAYTLQALGAIHAATQGHSARPWILGGLYMLLIIQSFWVIPLLTLGGVLDAAFRRGRRTPPSSSPNITT